MSQCHTAACRNPGAGTVCEKCSSVVLPRALVTGVPADVELSLVPADRVDERDVRQGFSGACLGLRHPRVDLEKAVVGHEHACRGYRLGVARSPRVADRGLRGFPMHRGGSGVLFGWSADMGTPKKRRPAKLPPDRRAFGLSRTCQGVAGADTSRPCPERCAPNGRSGAGLTVACQRSKSSRASSERSDSRRVTSARVAHRSGPVGTTLKECAEPDYAHRPGDARGDRGARADALDSRSR